MKIRAPDAAQRLFGDALQSRGPYNQEHSLLHGSRLCDAALHTAARPGHEKWFYEPPFAMASAKERSTISAASSFCLIRPQRK